MQVLRKQRDDLEQALKEEREERRLLEFNLTDIKEEFSRMTTGMGGLSDLSAMLAECRESHEVVKKKLKEEKTKNNALTKEHELVCKSMRDSHDDNAKLNKKLLKLEKLYNDLSSEYMRVKEENDIVFNERKQNDIEDTVLLENLIPHLTKEERKKKKIKVLAAKMKPMMTENAELKKKLTTLTLSEEE